MRSTGKERSVVLLVEDVEELRWQMKRAVESYGFLVIEAADDREAVSMAERARPSLILTEEEVPTFDSLTRRLCEHPTLSRVPVVIVNPDAEPLTHYGTAVLVADYDQLESVLKTSSDSVTGK